MNDARSSMFQATRVRPFDSAVRDNGGHGTVDDEMIQATQGLE